MNRVHVIAEAGTNHNAQPHLARALVDAAAEAGADSVKFQIIYPDGLYLPQFYKDGKYEGNEVFAKRAAGMLPDDAYRELARYAREQGLSLSASIFDQQGLDLLAELDPPYVKIASCDLNNLGLLHRAAALGRKLILSTGMSSLGDIECALQAIAAAGNPDLVLMHCVSVYPCRTEDMNLGFLEVLQGAFGFPVGLSDHTESSLAAAMAVALGATWIEKHLTLDRKSSGFDHAYAMEPAMMAAFVRDVRTAEAARQRPAAKVGPAESQVRQRARRALYAARDLAEGAVLTEADVLVVRPEGPLEPADLPRLLGRRLRRGVCRFQPLSYDCV
jgi:sialic acid synthase SpsE